MMRSGGVGQERKRWWMGARKKKIVKQHRLTGSLGHVGELDRGSSARGNASLTRRGVDTNGNMTCEQLGKK